VSFLKRPQNIQATEGESVEFYCSANGKPKPIIKWKKDGILINNNLMNDSINNKQFHYEFYQENQILKINELNKTMDSGIYECIASNKLNLINSKSNLLINQAIKPYFQIIQQNISVFEDHPVTLECFASGQPKPQVLWYKNGKRIRTDARVYFDPFGYLAIKQIKITDIGEYQCTAENIAGISIHNFYLSVKDIYGSIISNTIIQDAIEAAKQDITKQFQKTLNNLNDKRRPKTMSDLMNILRFPKDKTLDLVISEEIYERALDIIFRYASNITFNLTNSEEFITQEILTHRQLQHISDLSGCTRHKRKVQCSSRCIIYRTFDGTCNNLNNPLKGAANTPLKRLLNADYQNGFSTPRGWNKSQSYNGYMLPNARDISNHIISTKNITNDLKYSLMLMQWGQFVDHDMGHTVMAASLNRFSNGIACRDSCTNEQPCFPIEVFHNDTLRTHLPNKCMEFVRSSAVCGTGETR
jgi:peroxidase